MAYTAPQIGTILLKADRTMYKIGQIAYDNMFAEDNEALDYERDIIFIYKKSVEYADDLFLGTEKLDKVVERLAAKIAAYDYGALNPIYSDAAGFSYNLVQLSAVLNDLSDVTITNLVDNQLLRYNAAIGQWINVGPGAAVRNSQSFVATAGQTTFTTAYPFDSGLYDIFLNGVKLNTNSYTTLGEYTFILNDGAFLDDIIDITIYDPSTSMINPVNTLAELGDVSLGPLVNKQALYYNSSTGLWQNGLVFVPYTGAVANVDLGEFEIKAGQFTLDTSPTGVATVGTTRWNDSIGSSETTLKGGSVILKNGVDLVTRVVNKVTPNATLTKAAYQAVRVSGAQGQRLAIAYAQANNDNNSADTLGLAIETIPTNQEGFIMTVGQIEGINTTGSLQGETWVDGDVLYLSPFTAGAITNIKPTGPNHIVIIGYVEYAHQNNGKIYVKIMNGWELGELHDVDTAGATAGQVLKYNGTIWAPSADAGITGSGAAGQVAYFTGATTQAGNNNLFWDATNFRLGIGTNAPTRALQVQGTGFFADNLQVQKDFIGATTIRVGNLGTIDATTLMQFALSEDGATVNGYFRRYRNGTGLTEIGFSNALTFMGAVTGTPAERARIFATGNFGIGTGATDSGQKLQVIGDTLMRGSGATSASIGLTVQDSASTNLLRLRNDGSAILRNGLFFGTSTNNYIVSSNAGNTVDVAGLNLNILFGSFDTAGYGVQIGGYNASTRTVTSGASGTLNLAHGYAPTSGTGTYTMLQVLGTINQTGGANGITRGLYVNPTLTAAADWRSIEWSNNSGWGLYGQGTANNYMAGSFGIGSTSLTGFVFRATKNITGATLSYGIASDGVIQSDVTSTAFLYQTNASTASANFALTNIRHYSTFASTTFSNVTAGGSVSNQFGFYADSSLTGATTNYGFYGDIASGTGRWNLYMGGTAINFFNANLLIGSTTDSGEKLQVTGTMKVTGATAFGGNTTLTGAGLMTHTIVSTSTAGYSYMIFKNTGASGREMTLGIGGSTTGNDSNKFFIGDTTAGGAIRMIIDTSGNIGFGTYTPTVISGYTTLAVNNATNGGNIDLMTNGTRVASWNNTATETYFGTRTSTPLIITTNATEVAKFYANGNFRVGAAAVDSGERLQVTGTAKFTDTIKLKNGTTSSLALNFTLATTTGIYANDDGVGTNLKLQASGQDNQLVLYRNGNVGIGTNPSYKLDVQGTGTATLGRFVAPGNVTLLLSRAGTADNGDASFTVTNLGGLSITAASTIRFISGTTQYGAFVSGTGNLLLQNGGTYTDSGERLQVNGTAKITGYTAIGGNLGGANQRVANFRNSGGNAFIELQSSGAGAVALWAASANEFGIYQNATAGTIGTSVFYINSSGNVGVNTFTINASAKLQVDSTTQGFLPPRMTTTERNAIATPAAGLVVYDTTDNKHYGYNGTTWNAFY